MTDSCFSWSVELPERGARRVGDRSVRASLRISSEVGGEEELPVALAVGKRLKGLSDGPGAPSSRAELLFKLDELSRACAHERMEGLVNRRDYSSKELFSRLVEDGYTRSVSQAIVERACEVGILDDARFGAAFARSKVLSGWGRIKIERELSRRGVDASDIPGWPDEFLSPDEERERARALASRRRLTGKNDYQKIVRFLCSRGYSLGLSTSVAHEVADAGQHWQL